MKTKTLYSTLRLSILLLFVFPVRLSAATPYVILVSLDALRWDYPLRGITPNLDFIAENGVKALSVRSVFPSITFPNHRAIITGMYPENNGVIMNYFQNPLTKEKFVMTDTNSTRKSEWYSSETFWETAERNGVKTATSFWPYADMDQDSKRPSYHLSFNLKTPVLERIKGAVNWLKLPYNERPHFIALYFAEIDNAGHKYGPNSDEVNKSVRKLDAMIGILLDSLKKINLIDSVNIIVMSDHGMTDISNERAIDLKKMLPHLKYEIQSWGAGAMLEPQPDNFVQIYQKLKLSENHYKVYKKQDMPAYFHYSAHPFIYSLLIVPEEGWMLYDPDSKYFDEKKGAHGFEPNWLDMQGIFYAKGPAFKRNYQTGTLWNIDVYPLLCKIFNIPVEPKIDGKLERIEFILK